MILIVVVLLLVWVASLIVGATLGGAIHLLPLVAGGLLAWKYVQTNQAREKAAEHGIEAKRAAQRDMMRKALDSRPERPED